MKMEEENNIKIRCIAIDDEPLALDLMRKYISGFPALELLGTFEDAITGKEFIIAQKPDLIFMDINMPDINGLDLIRSLPDRPMIIFTTAHKKFAYEGFELDALDYLLKPIDSKRFAHAVEKAIEYFHFKDQQQGKQPESIFVFSEYRLVKITLAEVEYIESLNDYVKIHLRQAKPVLTLITLKSILDKLPESLFQRIHRSYIVPVKKVKSVHNRKVKLENGVELPVSSSYLDFINQWKKS